MTDQEIRDKLQSIYNRCRIAMFLLDMRISSSDTTALPYGVYEGIVTILEDICQDYQYILEKCTGEHWDKE